MPRLVLWSCAIVGLTLGITSAQAQTPPTNLLISGQTTVPIDTDGSGGPSADDSGYQVLYLPDEDCFVVVGTGVFEPIVSRGEATNFSAFNFQQTEGETGTVALEEITFCSDYYDGRQRLYAGSLEDPGEGEPTGYTNLVIQRQTFAPGSPLAPAGSGQLVDSNSDGILDAVQGTMSDGMPLSVLVDMQFYPDAENPTHAVLPAVLLLGDGSRGFYNAYIPMNPDKTITAVRADTGDPIGGVGLLDGVVVGALPRGLPNGAGPVGIPLLSRWGMAGLMLVLLGITVVGMRRLQS